MDYVLLAIAGLVGAWIIPRFLPVSMQGWQRTGLITIVRAAMLLLAVGAILATSVISIPANQVGIVRKIYGASNLPQGHLIAAQGETGYQATIIPPGTFKISLLFNVLNSVDLRPVVVVPNGFYGRIVARDGEALQNSQIMADAWPEDKYTNFLDAEYFLTNKGQRGLQLSILKPGTYPLNLALFEVRVGYRPNGSDITRSSDDIYDMRGKTQEDTPLDTSITEVPAGSVGVVRSSVQTAGVNCAAITAKTEDDGLTAVLVPQGCKGIWSTSLPPNNYYLNRDAFEVIPVSTRVTTLNFKGGYIRRYVDLTVDNRGDFIQKERTQQFDKTPDAADTAVFTKVEGWEIPQELRAIVQITPENAPIVVAAVGGQKEVDDRIIVPSIRSIVRNVFGGNIVVEGPGSDGKPVKMQRQTRVLDTIEHRPELEAAILLLAQADGRRAGVTVKEIRLGESAVPPELLLARQREQLAGQLKLAYAQEQIAQEQRQKTEQARAQADQQKTVVAAQISVQTAELIQEKRRAEGRGERFFLEEQAAGQTAQANVLGKENVLKLQQMKIFADLLAAHPELVANLKLPQVYVGGSGGGLDSAAAILGAMLPGSAAAAAAAK